MSTASSPDCSSAVTPRWKCSSNAKERIKTLVDYYSHRLRAKLIDAETAQMWVGEEPSSSSSSSSSGGGGIPTSPDAAAAASSSPSSQQQQQEQQPSTAADADSNENNDTTTSATSSTAAAPAASASANSGARKDTAVDVDSSDSKKKELSAQEILQLSVKMARKGFEDPPSFLLPEDDMDPLPAHCLHLNVLSAPFIKGCIADKKYDALEEHLTKGCADFETLLFAYGDHVGVMSGDIGVDRDEIVSIFEKLSNTENFSMRWSNLAKNASDFFSRWANNNWLSSTSLMFDSLPVSNAALFERGVACLFLTVPALATEACVRVCRAVMFAEESHMAKLLGRLSEKSMTTLLQSLQSHFTMYLMESNHSALNTLAAAMSLLHKANTAIVSRGLVPHTMFYNPTAIEFTEEAIVQDFKRSLRTRSEAGASSTTNLFCFSKYPCLVDTRFKSKLLQIEGIADAQQAQQTMFMRMLFAGMRGGAGRDLGEEMFCVLNIRRERLLESTLNELSRKSSKFRMPLKVKFVGEEGIDAGGVTKEFFQLITKELLEPKFGMFTAREDERVLWFRADVETSYLQREMFLVGQILGLAAYNSVIIDVRFPQLLYRKLLSVEPDMKDLHEIDHAMAVGLEKLLEYDEKQEGASVEDVFCRNFTYEHDAFGAKTEVEIVPGGKDIVLTTENRKEYVEAMVKYLLSDSVSRSFDQFKQGFLSVAARDMISTMHPVELETLLCGQPDLDFNEMEESCKYEGLKKSDDVVKWFWNIVHHRLDTEQQKRLLHFCTGSDRVPVGGLKELHFVIGKNGDGDDLLPTAHTCFNHLLLPLYSSEDVLHKKLLLAIENCEGFGLQ